MFLTFLFSGICCLIILLFRSILNFFPLNSLFLCSLICICFLFCWYLDGAAFHHVNLGKFCVVTFQTLTQTCVTIFGLLTLQQLADSSWNFFCTNPYIYFLLLSYCSVTKDFLREHLLRWVRPWVFDQVLILPSSNSHL